MWRNDEEKIDYFLSTTKNVLFQRILPIACLFRRIVCIYIYICWFQDHFRLSYHVEVWEKNLDWETLSWICVHFNIVQ